jgi:hypothetical protein
MDKCDCCGAEMKHVRVGKPLFACDDCRDVAVQRLGLDVTYVQIGIKK